MNLVARGGKLSYAGIVQMGSSDSVVIKVGQAKGIVLHHEFHISFISCPSLTKVFFLLSFDLCVYRAFQVSFGVVKREPIHSTLSLLIKQPQV